MDEGCAVVYFEMNNRKYGTVGTYNSIQYRLEHEYG
jgi:hypothetical protein